MSYNSKYTGQEVEQLLDTVANGGTGGGGTVNWDDIQGKPNVTRQYLSINGYSGGFLTPINPEDGYVDGISMDGVEGVLISSGGLTFIPEFIEEGLSDIWKIHNKGSGTKFLSDDGTYKEINGGGGTTTETDPVFSASPASTITEEKIAEWNGKQDTISDLDTIRNGASAGATALQSVPSEYVTETELAEAIASAITTTLNTSV